MSRPYWQTREFAETVTHLSVKQLADTYPDVTHTTWSKRRQRMKQMFADLPWADLLPGSHDPAIVTPELKSPPPVPPAKDMARPEDRLHKLYLKPTAELVFGLCGDTHGNSAEEKLAELHTFYDVCKSEGVADVFHTGDIDAGENTYPGQRYEVQRVGFDPHVTYLCETYPEREGMTTHFVGGNHDFTWYKALGIDIGNVIQSRRPDMHYLGKYGATVELSPGCPMYLLHPDGGVNYAVSYKRQRIVEGFLGGTKPRIFASGHDHQAIHFRYRNTEIFGTGCFEGQTLFLRRKGIQPQIGGWIVWLKLDENGAIRRCKAEFIEFYEAY